MFNINTHIRFIALLKLKQQPNLTFTTTFLRVPQYYTFSTTFLHARTSISVTHFWDNIYNQPLYRFAIVILQFPPLMFKTIDPIAFGFSLDYYLLFLHIFLPHSRPCTIFLKLQRAVYQFLVFQSFWSSVPGNISN